jgi:hypothetical protein
MDADDGKLPLPQELERAKERFNRRREAVRKREGAGATEEAQAVTRKYISELAAALKRVMAEPSSQSVHREFLAVIRDLDPAVLAACVLRGAQHSIGQSDGCRDTALRIGGLIADECWAQKLTEDRPVLAEHVEYQAGQLSTTTERRKKYARTIAARYGYKGKYWDNERQLRAGEWSLSVLLEALPDVFQWEAGPRTDGKQGGDQFLTFTEHAQDYATAVVEQAILSNPCGSRNRKRRVRGPAGTRAAHGTSGLHARSALYVSAKTPLGKL